MTELILLPIVAALAAAPFVAEALRRPIDTRKAPGKIAQGADGPTHFRWHGPEDGRVALCIHGLTTPSFVFDGLAGHLARQGFRVLTYDLPGRGFTPPRPGPEDIEFFLSQLRSLLVAEGIEEVDLLVGYSMGGSVATAFTAAEPDRVERLVLLAPSGLFYDPGPVVGAIRRVPVLGDWAIRVLGGWILRRGIDNSLGPFARAQRAETRKRGYFPAILSSLRHTLSVHLGGLHKEIAEMGVPVLAVWGEEDFVIPVSNVGRLAELNRKAHQTTIEGATHAMPYSHHAEVAEAIREFLAETAW